MGKKSKKEEVESEDELDDSDADFLHEGQDESDGDEDEQRQDLLRGLDPCLLTIDTQSHVFDAAFHPDEKQPILATALVSGHVDVFRYNLEDDESEVVSGSTEMHKGSVRNLIFTNDGKILSVGSRKGVMTSTVEGKKVCVRRVDDAANCILAIDQNRFVVGDDAGGITMFDQRQKEKVMFFQEHDGYVSDFAMHKDGKSLVSVGGDGCLAVYNLNQKGKLVAMSDPNEDEFLSIEIMKNGKKVMCGSVSGAVNIFSWGDFGDLNDRLTGVPDSCDAIQKISENTMITGSADGVLRVASVFPNKIKGVLGEHSSKTSTTPEAIQSLAMGPSGDLVCSCAHDSTVKIWSLAEALKIDRGEDSRTLKRSREENFFAGLDL